LAELATVNPVRFQNDALTSHSPYPGLKPAVGTEQDGVVVDTGLALLRIAVEGPLRMIGAALVPDFWVRNRPS
jgi:hypothetical protein